MWHTQFFIALLLKTITSPISKWLRNSSIVYALYCFSCSTNSAGRINLYCWPPTRNGLHSSGKTFSQSIISLKEQSLYLDIQKIINDNKNNENDNQNNYKIPLLFGAFSHCKDLNKSISFYSKIFIYEPQNQEFKDISYEIINLQKVQYNVPIEPLLNKNYRTIAIASLKTYENEVNSLKNIIENSVNEIQSIKLGLIQKYKKLINNELENYDILVMRKKMMKEGNNK